MFAVARFIESLAYAKSENYMHYFIDSTDTARGH